VLRGDSCHFNANRCILTSRCKVQIYLSGCFCTSAVHQVDICGYLHRVDTGTDDADNDIPGWTHLDLQNDPIYYLCSLAHASFDINVCHQYMIRSSTISTTSVTSDTRWQGNLSKVAWCHETLCHLSHLTNVTLETLLVFISVTKASLLHERIVTKRLEW